MCKTAKLTRWISSLYRGWCIVEAIGSSFDLGSSNAVGRGGDVLVCVCVCVGGGGEEEGEQAVDKIKELNFIFFE